MGCFFDSSSEDIWHVIKGAVVVRPGAGDAVVAAQAAPATAPAAHPVWALGAQASAVIAAVRPAPRLTLRLLDLLEDGEEDSVLAVLAVVLGAAAVPVVAADRAWLAALQPGPVTAVVPAPHTPPRAVVGAVIHTQGAQRVRQLPHHLLHEDLHLIDHILRPDILTFTKYEWKEETNGG